jgi:hypothetical protein
VQVGGVWTPLRRGTAGVVSWTDFNGQGRGRDRKSECGGEGG